MKKLLLTLSLVAIAATAGAGSVSEISLKSLKNASAKRQVVIVDANGIHSYREAHIPGAIDFAAHKKNLAVVLPSNKNTLIVAYGSHKGSMTGVQAAEAIRALGYRNVKVFAPGLAGWRAAGEQTSKAPEGAKQQKKNQKASSAARQQQQQIRQSSAQ